MPASNPVEELLNSIPTVARGKALVWINKAGVEVKLVSPRKGKFGDYRYPLFGKTSRITLNKDLEPQLMLLVFCHELAHAVVFMKLGRNPKPHGKEWKFYYRRLLDKMIELQAFDSDVSREITTGLYRNTSSGIYRVYLKRLEKDGFIQIKNIAEGKIFLYGRNRRFIRREQRRKRIKGEEEKNGRVYLFDPICLVKPLE
ncbi:MAG: SprT-like domain-containing protein [Bacteroidota bacterium]